MDDKFIIYDDITDYVKTIYFYVGVFMLFGLFEIPWKTRREVI